MHAKTLEIFFNLFKACHDGSKLYPTGNPVVEKQFQNLSDKILTMLAGDSLTLEIFAGMIRVNKEPVPEKLVLAGSSAWFVSVCLPRHISSIIIYRGAKLVDLLAMMGLFHSDPRDLPHQGSAPTQLAIAGVTRVAVNMAPSPAKLVSDTSATFSSFEPEPLPDGEADPFELALDVGSKSVPEDFKLFISEGDQEELRSAVNGEIRKNNLRWVGNTLTMIRRDLSAREREDRELAFSSYHVVIGALIDNHQDMSLVVVIKTLAKDFEHCKEDDLYHIHLATLMRMVNHFKNKAVIAPLALATNLLARENLRRHGQRQAMVNKHLHDILSLNMVKQLIDCKDTSCKESLDQLFGQHGPGVLQPLLEALFEAEERSVRKRLIEILLKFGPLSYPLLLLQLEQAIELKKPWYIKRNLLTLLSVRPPMDLVPMLGPLYQEGHPKMQDLVVRCLFQIPGPQAHQMGRDMLRSANDSRLKTLLHYIYVSKEVSYAEDMIEVFRRASEGNRMKAISCLSRFASTQAQDCLKLIISQSLGDVKVRTEHRLAALRALTANRFKRERAFKIISKYKQDKNADVRTLANQLIAQISA